MSLMKELTLRIVIIIMAVLTPSLMRGEDGHSLWLRMERNAEKADVELQIEKRYKKTPTLRIAQVELADYWHGSQVVKLQLSADAPGRDGFSIAVGEGEVTLRSASDHGLLYGAYALLRMQETGNLPSVGQTVSESPSYDVRILNHWDNPNGTIERGYSGRSIWKWDELPKTLSPIYEEYARANASIGINATVLNNVNAKPMMLSDEMVRKWTALANVFRPYGIRVYVSVNFASPKVVGGLPTADPFDADVKEWWRSKVVQIYKAIPDFGGFLVKANSEGEPGPQDYGRTHADGANMLADVLAPHGGIVMWRAFVYSATGGDRARQAYDEFMPFDGKFRDNVLIQIKNGPVDFQPREPFSPLFGAMKHTQVMPEFQITQEYLGHSIHTAFLAPMWKETLDADTYQSGAGTTIAKVTTGQVYDYKVTAMAGVANIGDNRNWCGSDLAQANWYAFGRLCWNTSLTSAGIADEFLKQTYTTDERFVLPMRQLLLRSREAVVDYMMPLGLHHIFAGGHHYGPEPWCNPPGWRIDWLPKYYHKADSIGIGFDRSVSGSNAAAQYHEPLATLYGDINTCPDRYLLWFHHVGWNHVMHNGLTLWDNLCYTYDRGVASAQSFVGTWESVRPYIDSERYELQLQKFRRQAQDAVWWRDACLLYFQTFSHKQLPPDSPKPHFSLDNLMKYRLDIDNYTAPDINSLPVW